MDRQAILRTADPMCTGWPAKVRDMLSLRSIDLKRPVDADASSVQVENFHHTE
jgi:hypothetical protein